jgi:hypothetical protein
MGKSLWVGLVATAHRLDALFRRLVGEENDLLRHFLWAALPLLVVALLVINWTMGPNEARGPAAPAAPGESIQDRQEDAREAERLKQEQARRREIARKAEQDRQREAAETARKKADEEKQRQEREAEEKRLAAAEESRHAAENPPAAQPAPEVAAPASTRTDADAWKTKAEQFARDHLGRFIDDEPLIEGQAEIPLDILPPAQATTTWFLGNGRIYLENPTITYAFGDGFEKELPDVRYEVPKLAADLHLKSAFVELHPRDNVLQLVVGGTLPDSPRGSEDDKKARTAEQPLVDLKLRCQKISALIYQPVLRPGGSAPAGGTPAVSATPAASPSATPPNREPADAASPPAIDGAFHYEARVLTKLRAPLMARVKFVVIGAGGKKLPSELRQSVIVGSLLFEKNKEGMIRLIETPQIQVQEVGAPMTNLIYQGAVSLRPQIRFSRRPANRFQSKFELVAVSTGQPIEPVEQDREYTVRFEISAGGLEKLMQLLEGHKPPP